jgi:hypothetical protein
MKRFYYCLKCSTHLNPGTKIILTFVAKCGQGLILFSPQPGNYSVIVSEATRFRQGEVVQFCCPVCHADLTSSLNKNLAEIGFRFPEGPDGRVLFSRRYGEHATYFVTKEEARSYGENAQVYSQVNFFGEGPKD